VTLMDKLLSVIEAILKHPATVKPPSLAELAETKWSTLLKFLVLKVVPKLGVVLAAYVLWLLAHGGAA
jgi:hypothetical protein